MKHTIDPLINSNSSTASQILDVTQLAYTKEAELINFQGIPYLNQSIEDIQQSEEIFWGYKAEDRIVGVISFKLLPNAVLDIHRLVIHPAYFRQGIAYKLLIALVANYPAIAKFIVSTASKNLPAINLYQKAGFRLVGTGTIEAGSLQISRLEKST